MTVDFTWNIGIIVQIAVLVFGGLITLVTLKNTVSAIKDDMAVTKRENDKRFDAIQNELEKLGDILVNMARFDERLANLDQRVTEHGRRIADLSRGDGYVQQRKPSRGGLDGEYP